jgi:hypothetical protein
VAPGADGRFDGTGEVIHEGFYIKDYEPDAEGIAIDPATGHLSIVSNEATAATYALYTVFAAAGTPLYQVEVPLPRPALRAKSGITWLPDSTRVCITNRGVDNDTNPLEDDGSVACFTVPPPPHSLPHPSIPAVPP